MSWSELELGGYSSYMMAVKEVVDNLGKLIFLYSAWYRSRYAGLLATLPDVNLVYVGLFQYLFGRASQAYLLV